MEPRGSLKPTDSELAILKVLWEIGPATVAQVHDILVITRKTGLTTTQKLMQIMTRKGLLQAEASRRPFLYSASESATQTKSKLVNDFMNRVFDGSVSQLLLQAMGQETVSPEELDAVEAYLNQQREKEKEP